MIQDTIQEAISLILGFKLVQAVDLLKPVFEQHPKLKDSSEIVQIDDTLRTMLTYMKRNANDPDRKKLYVSLLRRTFRVASDLEISWRCKNVGFYVTQFQKSNHLNMSPDFIKTVLETFVSDVAMLSLDGDSDAVKNKKEEIYARHQTFIERLFAAITISCQWTDGERDFWSQLLTSPTIDTSDAQVITSAIALSAMNQFDPNKSMALANIYTNSSDVALRERALVGFVQSIDSFKLVLFGDLCETINKFISRPGVAHELMELQKQIFYCLNAESDTKKIEKEIMPDLKDNVPYKVTGLGMIEEKEQDKLRDILHPDADDKAMEKIEQSMNKIADMQKQGADIYFGGFSHMKRFPFFSTAANWFMPFSLDQPDISKIRDKLGNGNLIHALITKSSFCESDKYSFTFAFASVIDHMPANMREVLTSSGSINFEIPEEEAHSKIFIRRQYLQDLYRFFRLHPQRNDLVNPFEDEGKRFFFVQEPFLADETQKLLPSLSVFLHDQRRYDDLQTALRLFNKKQQDTLTYNLLLGSFMSHANDFPNAEIAYSAAVKKDPDNEMALRGEAHAAMMNSDFDVAVEAYGRLLNIYPGKKSFLVNRTLAQLNNGDIDGAAETMYEADYRYPEDDNVRRIKAWLFLNQKKSSEAIDIYNKLAGSKPQSEDYLNMGYAYWVNRDYGNALKAFCKFLDLDTDADIESEFYRDFKLLKLYGLDNDDISLMEELIDAEH